MWEMKMSGHDSYDASRVCVCVCGGGCLSDDAEPAAGTRNDQP